MICLLQSLVECMSFSQRSPQGPCPLTSGIKVLLRPLEDLEVRVGESSYNATWRWSWCSSWVPVHMSERYAIDIIFVGTASESSLNGFVVRVYGVSWCNLLSHTLYTLLYGQCHAYAHSHTWIQLLVAVQRDSPALNHDLIDGLRASRRGRESVARVNFSNSL